MTGHRPIRPDQIRVIHTLKGKAGLDDVLYRGMLSGFGVSSSKDLTVQAADRLIDSLREATPERPADPKAVPMTGRYGAKIRALWIAGWNLGVVHDRSDQAACAFVERQTGVIRTAWLVDPAQGRAAIEALKGWLAREAAVIWPTGRAPQPAEHKAAVVAAQWRRLVVLGVVHTGPDPLAGLLTTMEAQLGRELQRHDDPGITSPEFDAVSRRLGQRIRKAVSGRATARRAAA